MSDMLELPSLLLVLAVLVLPVMGAGVGFVCGLWCAPWWRAQAIRRAAKEFDRLFTLAVQELESAADCCQQMAVLSPTLQNPRQLDRFESARQSLNEAISAVVQQQRSGDLSAILDRPPREPLAWEPTPTEPHSGLPNEQAFQTNLNRMIEAGLPASLLLVRIDQWPRLLRRVGHVSSEYLLGRLVSVLLRAGDSSNLICRLEPDLLGILMPFTSPLAGMRQADRMRTAVRSHHFQLETTSVEVFVSGSFGLSCVLPGEKAELCLDRANAALRRSQAVGRYNLHVDEGTRRGVVRLG